MKLFTTKKLVIAALFAALACVSTMSIRIPIQVQADTYILAMQS